MFDMILGINTIARLVFAGGRIFFFFFAYLGKSNASECLNSYAIGARNSSNY